MKNFEKKLIKRYVGFDGERDEYQKSKIYEILASANVLTVYFVIILMMISLIWDLIRGEMSLGTFLLFIVVQANSIYVLPKIKKYNLQQTEFYNQESFNKAIKGLKKRCIFGGLNFFFTLSIINLFFSNILSNEKTTVQWLPIVITLVFSFAFGFTLYFVFRQNLKLVKDDEE